MPDAEVAKMLNATRRAAVLKQNLILYREKVPRGNIFVFEGMEDILVYSQWTLRVSPALSYNPYLLNGKEQVLLLWSALSRDLDGLGDDIYFFIDRDYDDNKGHRLDDKVFMTDRYSIENYLVTPEVVSDVLRNELCCYHDVHLQSRLEALFSDLYSAFLIKMLLVNLRLFAAVRLGIDLIPGVPKKCVAGETVGISTLDGADVLTPQDVRLTREPTAEELEALSKQFQNLDPALRHRGKFAYEFMMKWFRSIDTEVRRKELPLFSSMNKVGRTLYHEIGPRALASRSPIPEGLAEFLVRFK